MSAKTQDAPDDDKEVFITPEQLDEMMPPGDFVHTFIQSGHALIGADHSRASLLELAREGQAELSGATATAMKHGAAICVKGRSPLFIATK